MNQTYTKSERAHLDAVKSLPCAVCGDIGKTEAHHIKQDNPYSCCALCDDCHRGAHNGIHGLRSIWKVKRMDEIDALIKTFQMLLAQKALASAK